MSRNIKRQDTMADHEDTDDATTAVPHEKTADSNQADDAGTPAAHDEDLQSPPLDVDELPAH
jgi:hypothetical protein